MAKTLAHILASTGFRIHAGLAMLGIALLAVFSNLYVADFTAPLIGISDLGHYSAAADYFARHLELWPLPHLDLINDEYLYPYGTSHVFHHWSFEASYWNALGRAVVGPGPWLQSYFVLSLLITSIGSYALLVRPHGPWRAALASVVLTYGNFFVLERYPDHYPFAALHWFVLGLLTDYRILQGASRGEFASPGLLGLRVFFLVALLGLDLPYIAGLGITAFCTASIWILYLYYRHHGWSWLKQSGVASGVRIAGEQARGHPWLAATLLAAIGAALFLYLPITLQIVWESAAFEFSDAPQLRWWAHPLRLLLPVIPGLELGLDRYEDLFGDDPTKVFDMRPGVGLLVLGTLGLAFGTRGRFWFLAPFVFLLMLIVLEQIPGVSPLGAAPWMRFARIPARFVAVIPLLYCLFALQLPRFSEQRTWLKAIVSLSAMFVMVETWHAYTVMAPAGHGSSRPDLVVVPDEALLELMRAVRDSPGEAVLEWPFVVVAGNGVGIFQTGAFYVELSSTMQLHQLHEKKTIGVYYGRLHMDQLAPLIEAGWPELLKSDPADFWGPARMQHRLDDAQWSFMLKHFTLNDYCGVLLFADLTHADNLERWYAHLGQPIAEAQFPSQGRIQFIPKPASWRSELDPELGREVRLER